LSPRRVLITTFGFDEGKILSAMRMLAYDKLVLVTGKDSLEKEGYKHLQEIESRSPNGMETVVVNVFSFTECLKRIEEVIEKYSRKGNEVLLNVSGGTKVLSDAALFAGFQKGIRSYHCEEECLELPIIVGLDLKERLSEMQIEVLKKLDEEVERKSFEKTLVEEGHSLFSVQEAIRKLRTLEILGVEVKKGGIYISINESHRYFQDIMAE